MSFQAKYKMLITYWAPSGGDDGFGHQNFAAPVTFKGFWADKEQSFLSAKGEQVVSRAIVHYPQQMAIVPDGWLARGIQTATDPRQVPGSIIVRKTDEVPDLRNLEVVKRAYV